MKSQPNRRIQSHAGSYFRALGGILLGLVLFAALAAAAVYGLFAISGAAAVQPTAHSSIPDTGQEEPTTRPSITPTPAGPTQTPFLPVTNTPTSTLTPTPTATPTVTLTPTPTQTSTPTSTQTPLPTDTPEPPTEAPPEELPDSAMISGVTGYNQSLPLSCEARSAVDWARYFGLEVGEMEFQEMLPASDNPNTGFVGNPWDERGGIPPRSYGVHSAPVAALLRSYGLNAHSYAGMSLNEIQREIAAGRPVIAWVVGNVWLGRGVAYTASDGETLTVVPFEHTVIVIGFDEETVTVVDGSMVYSPIIERFMDLWRVLDYQGIILE